MFVEYVDANSGAGFAVTIYNPTSAPINTATGRYKVLLQNNNRLVDSALLTVIIPPGGIWKVGNASHCQSDCRGNCDQGFVGNSNGVNGDDAIALVKGNRNQFVDMLGLWGNSGSTRIGGTNNAFYQRRLVRSASNCQRYTSTSGSGSDSWPSASNQNVTGWSVFPASGANSCLANSYTSNYSPQSFSLGPDVSICAGTPYTLRAPVTTGGTLTWSTGSTAPAIVVTAAGKYWVRLSNGLCSITDTIEVRVTATGSAGLGPDRSICTGRTVWVKPSVRGTTTNWSTGEVGDSIQIGIPGTYTVSVISGTCVSRDTIVITQQPPLRNYLGGDVTLCPGNPISIPNTGFGPIRVHNGAGFDTTGTNITLKATGTYFAQRVDPASCQELDTLVVLDGAIADTIPTVAIGCADAGLTLAGPANMDAYAWSTGDTTTTIRPTSSGSYQLTVTRGNCIKSYAVAVTLESCEWFMPNLLTPNGDGLNDALAPSKDVFASASTRVYNRYGVLVANLDAPGINWKAEGLPAGTYFYRAEVELKTGAKQQLKGWVEVLK